MLRGSRRVNWPLPSTRVRDCGKCAHPLSPRPGLRNMRHQRLLLTISAVVPATLWAYACGDGDGTTDPTDLQQPTTVTVSPATATVVEGDTLRLTATATNAHGQVVSGVEFVWASGNTAVATVDAFGLVTAVSGGEATITATAGEASGDALVTVAIDLERAALVALYDATDGPNWVDNTNWLTDLPLGEWYGVETDTQGRVVGLYLSGRRGNEAQQYKSHGLRGELPVELRNLTELESLNLSFNTLTGPIPPELGDLANLRVLHLGYTFLTGPIPPELGNLAKLELLNLLSVDGFRGPIPPELGNLVNLRSLTLGTGLTGSVPPELVELANLRYLELNGNNLSGPIPPWLGELTNLESLSLVTNQFTGSIPPELGSLARLEWLSLWRNDLTGPVPPELGNLVNLRHLGIGGNRLTGTIPQTLLNLPELESLDWSCGLRGVCVPGTLRFRRVGEANGGNQLG